MMAVMQGSLNPAKRITFLNEYLNELLMPKLLTTLISEPLFNDFFQLSSRHNILLLNLCSADTKDAAVSAAAFRVQSAYRKL